MAFLVDAVVVLLTSMMLDCTPVPVQESEYSQIAQAALQARPVAFANEEFKSQSVTKCIVEWPRGELQPDARRTEQIRFYGHFGDSIQADGYRERSSVQCEKSVDYLNDTAVDQRDGCTAALERYMQYDDFDHEVRLLGSVSVEDATAFLNYLKNYDFGKENKERIGKELKLIQSVELSEEQGQPQFRASYSHGCTTTEFTTMATRGQFLTFGKVHGSKAMC